MSAFLRFCLKFITSSFEYCLNLFNLAASAVFRGDGVHRGNGQPVLLIPGFLIGDISMAVIKFWLKRMGYSAYPSNASVMGACPYKTAQCLEQKLDDIYHRTGQPVIVIGYSLGGAIARFLARKYPAKVGQVITIGTPPLSDIKVDPFLYKLFQKFNPECISRCDCEMVRGLRNPNPVFETLVYSKDDETVLSAVSEVVTNGSYHQVSGSHGGLVVNPEVYKIIALCLSRS